MKKMSMKKTMIQQMNNPKKNKTKEKESTVASGKLESAEISDVTFRFSRVFSKGFLGKCVKAVLLVFLGFGVWCAYTFIGGSRAYVVDPFDRTAKYCSIAEYGASVSDFRATREAFGQAFAACAPDGTVVVPEGRWNTGGITVPGEVTLFFEDGAILNFSQDPNDYLPVVATRFEGMDVMNYQPFIYIPEAKNVAIIGNGTLYGNGASWWGWRLNKNLEIHEGATAEDLYEMSKNNVPIFERVFGSEEKPLRPSFIQPYKSENIVISGLTLYDGPMWTIHPVYSKNVTIKNITFESDGPNTDGIAIDSSENVEVLDSYIKSGDDAVVIKSGLDYDGWKQNIPSKNILIKNVKITGGRGAVAIGSEMSGGVENVRVEDCVFKNTDIGIRMKTLKGRGGYIRDISYSNIEMYSIEDAAIQIDMKYKYSTVKNEGEDLPVIDGITIENVFARNIEDAFRIGGREDANVQNITVKDVKVISAKVGRANDVTGARFENVIINSLEKDELEMKRVADVEIVGDTKIRNGKDPFAEISGKETRNVVVDIDGCEHRACVLVDSDVPSGEVEFR